MKADTVDLAAIFGQPVRYLVPMFQRPYVWKRDTEWVPLWEDIESVLERQLDDTPANDATPHFLGAVVLDQVLTPTGMVTARYVIDGQQRLTTLQLFIAAAREIATEHGLEGPSQMLGKLLFNESYLLKQPDDKFKIVPTVFDRDAFRHAVGESAGTSHASASHRMLDAHAYFREALTEWAVIDREPDDTARRLEVLSTVLWKLLVVVAIDLDQRDNAQVIFETLNARGTPLLAADLIKNHLFQAGAAQGLNIDELYATYWQPLDMDWWRAEVQQGRLKRPRLDIFMNHWLSMRLGEEVVSHLLFPTFKRYLVGAQDHVVDVLAELAAYAVIYETFERESDGSPMGQFLYRLNVMEVTTAYPFLLWMFGPGGISDDTERLRAARAIESWLARRVIVRGNTQGYTQVFVSLLNQLRKSPAPSATDVAAYFNGLEGERGYWPSDDQIKAAFRTSPVYSTITRARLRMILEAMEEELRSAYAEQPRVARDLTIEHVLPQEWHANWPLPSDVDPAIAAEQRDALKQSIGNLTLVTSKLNPKMSNGPWTDKREALRQLSVLLLTSDLRDAEVWNEAAIRARSDRLADLAMRIWPGPASGDWS